MIVQDLVAENLTAAGVKMPLIPPGSSWARGLAPNTSFAPQVIANVGFSNILGTLNTLQAVPIWIPPGSGALKSLGLVTTVAGGAGSLTRVGYYANDPVLFYPTSLIFDSGDIDTSATVGFVGIGTDLTLPTGTILWSVINVGVGAPTFKSAGATITIPLLGLDRAALAARLGYQVAQAYGAMPAVFPAGAAFMVSSVVASVPIVIVEPA